MKPSIRWPVLLAFALWTGVSAAQSMPPEVTVRDGVLADGKGMTLYVFDKDSAGKSACNGPCAVNWPPLKAGAQAKATGAWTVVSRDDDTRQWAYKDRPLYTWIKDQKPGDRTGEGVANNTWHVAKP